MVELFEEFMVSIVQPTIKKLSGAVHSWVTAGSQNSLILAGSAFREGKLPYPNSVDTRLRHRGPRFELGRGIVAERGVTTQPIIEHLDILKDVLCCFLTRAVSAMVDEFAFECPEEAFDTGVVPTVPPSRHADSNAMLGEQLLVACGSILAPPIRVVQQPGLRVQCRIAIVSACCARSTVSRVPIAQPITAHE